MIEDVKRDRLCYFGVNVSQSNIVSSIFFGDRALCNYHRHFQRHTNYFTNNHFVFCEDRKQTLSCPMKYHGTGYPQSSGTIMY